MTRFEDKVAIVTGAAGGVGEATATRLVEEGATVFLLDVQEELGAAVAQRIGGQFRRHDITDESAWTALIAEIMDCHGRLDAIVNNAAILVHQDVEHIVMSDWDRVMRINVTGTMLGCTAAIRAMKQNPGGPSGSIVNVSSVAGFIAAPGSAAYTASKGAVRSFTKAVAVHCARQYCNIRCNSVHPGAVDTPIHAARLAAGDDVDAVKADMASFQPMGRMATSEEVAAGIVFLASSDASFITGTELVVDGGWLAAGGNYTPVRST